MYSTDFQQISWQKEVHSDKKGGGGGLFSGHIMKATIR